MAVRVIPDMAVAADVAAMAGTRMLSHSPLLFRHRSSP
jgi:hypothetical protein